ncbi:hypothetical protein EGW08_006485, partial [Elysia chlorotica]
MTLSRSGNEGDKHVCAESEQVDRRVIPSGDPTLYVNCESTGAWDILEITGTQLLDICDVSISSGRNLAVKATVLSSTGVDSEVAVDGFSADGDMKSGHNSTGTCTGLSPGVFSVQLEDYVEVFRVEAYF